LTESSSFLESLECSLLPGSYPNSGPVPDLYNSTYNYWKKTWTAFFEKAGSGPNALNVDNFMRSRYVIVLHRQLEIVGSLSCSVFNSHAEVSFDHPGVKPFPELVQEMMKRLEPNACITGEYLSVNPDYRKSVVGISLADAMVGILLQIMLNESLGAMIATPVRAAKVADITKCFGAAEVGSYLKIGVDCQMIYVTREMYRPHPDKRVNEFVQELWARRRDFTKTENQRPKLRVA